MNKEKKFIEGGGGYLSGCGIVYLEDENNIYDLGNCPKANFYQDGRFELIFEDFSKENIKLFFGNAEEEIVEKKSVSPKNELKIDYYKFDVNAELSKSFKLTFEGLNTANSNNSFVLETNVVIGFPYYFSVLNDDVNQFLVVGQWDKKGNLYLQKERKDEYADELAKLSFAKDNKVLVVTPKSGGGMKAFNLTNIEYISDSSSNLAYSDIIVSGVRVVIPVTYKYLSRFLGWV